MTARRRHTPTENKSNGQGGWIVSNFNPTNNHQPLEMTCRDRTNEFMSAVKYMQSRTGNGVTTINRQTARQVQHSDFMRMAKHIGSDINQTFTKLEKLTILAKKKSLFDDKSVEIQELTYIIKQDINSLNKQIAKLQEFVRRNNSQNGRQMQTHSNTVVLALQSKLANMSNDFKSVLEVRTQNLKDQKDRREQFSQDQLTTSLPPSASSGNIRSVLVDDEAASRGDAVINMPFDRPQQSSMQLVEQQDTYIKDREETMQNIESTIVELGGIFQQLAHMIHEQEEQVQRIDSNVDDAYSNVEMAHGEILKYFQSVTSNRWLMVKVFGVLIVFFIIFVVFMA
ncbi:syntaxin-5-like [Anneissia japonica]|uniref:syntaxin-5-like n=1 Tax=Anneissia japonica TaxID=1529436 RepID=UPI001425ACEB|nr:syntaxin-5-like [Anneissia japonica]XP_033115790.1 syntaxin-5-like [Anneissia japonica]